MLHSEHFDKADATYEIRHDNNGNVIHVHFKDGELIIFPTAYDLFQYILNGGDQTIERFYASENEWHELYDMPEYDYYELKAAWLKKHPSAKDF
jgi:frataxin-like iron-binding protein CyaY